jgi:hypothetical protein
VFLQIVRKKRIPLLKQLAYHSTRAKNQRQKSRIHKAFIALFDLRIDFMRRFNRRHSGAPGRYFDIFDISEK